jgi:hypothetical protein
MEVDRHGKAYRAIIKRMGADGKLGVGWPKEYGGHGFGPVEQSIFVNEAARADVPLPAVTLQTVGPTLQEYGTEAQKKKFLPAILAGESISPSAIPSRRRAPTWLHCAPPRCAGATSTSSTVRRSGPRVATTPITSGWRAAPIRMR